MTPYAPADSDGDKVPDYLESSTLDTDGDGSVNQADSDADGDGLEDGDEDSNRNGVVDTGESDPLDECSPNACPNPGGDDDGDGLTNEQEAALGTLPGNADTDKDGVPDGDDDAPNNPCVPSLEAEACAKNAADISVTSSVEGLGESGLVKAGEVFSLVSMTKNKGADIARNVKTEHKIPASLEMEGAPEVNESGSCQVTDASGSEPLIVTCTWPTLKVGVAARVTVKLKMPAVTAE